MFIRIRELLAMYDAGKIKEDKLGIKLACITVKNVLKFARENNK